MSTAQKASPHIWTGNADQEDRVENLIKLVCQNYYNNDANSENPGAGTSI